VDLATTLVLDHKQTCLAEELEELFPVVDIKLEGALILEIIVALHLFNSLKMFFKFTVENLLSAYRIISY
jgi:hypothetical protein